MQHASHARCGAVLHDGSRSWLIWTADQPHPVCIPIQNRRQPLTRWDYPLPRIPGVKGNALIAATRAARSLETSGMTIVGHLSDDLLADMGRTMRRAAESVATEARFTIRA